jgi:predicted homoserine dehydrogenase-like protein
MSLHQALASRAAEGAPFRVAVVGAGTFALMFLAQARRMSGVHIVAVVDLDVPRAMSRLASLDWPSETLLTRAASGGRGHGATYVTDRLEDALAQGSAEVLVEATGDPCAGVCHALAGFEAGCHVVMVNVEADALVGPLLARRAADEGVVYSLAYGDQPALICELVDWARTCGMEVVAAGKGTRYLPNYRTSTPETVWKHYGLGAERARSAGYNPKMYNSFLDGTKSAIEMTAVANATGIQPPIEGLAFPPASIDELASVLRPRSEGGALERTPVLEVVSSLRRSGEQIDRDLRWGVYVAIRASDDYVAERFADYGVPTDDTGRHAVVYRTVHFVGLELGPSIASVAVRGEPTGAPTAFVGDVVAVAKRDLRAGDVLDGEGGYTVRGEALPASRSLRDAALPVGLASGIAVTGHVRAGDMLSWSDVELDDREGVAAMRRQMERSCSAANAR